MIETADIPPVQDKVEPKRVQEVKPELADVITAKESEHEIVPNEIKPQQQRPDDVPIQQQAPQVANLTQQSSGAEQRAGDAPANRNYLGQLRRLLEKSKISPRAMPASMSRQPLDVEVPFKFVTR